MSEVDAKKVEALTTWYTLFCTLMDQWIDGELSELLLIAKLQKLRNSLVTHIPEVEAEMLKLQQKRGRK